MRIHAWSSARTLGVYLIVMGVAISRPILIAAQANANEEVSADARRNLIAADPANEDAACARCHEKVVKSFVNDPHASQGQLAGRTGVRCASCHGPGEPHIQSGGDKSKIFNPTETAVRAADDSCLKCHAGKHAIFERSAHGRSNVGCVGCHSIHATHESKQPDLCFQCHEDQRSQFSAPFRHKVLEGVVLCTDCHDPHGSFGEQLQRSAAQLDFICTKCHAEMAAPFKYEHAIVKTEGCIACHSPHGSPTSHLLNRARVNTICLLCHFPPQVSSTGESVIAGHDPATVQLCTDCHADTHGSNSSAAFLKKN